MISAQLRAGVVVSRLDGRTDVYIGRDAGDARMGGGPVGATGWGWGWDWGWVWDWG